jgi:outer membrane protein OmpA-like peptidoglycan-associated protein
MLYILLLFVCVFGLEACGVLQNRVVPTPLPIEQVQRQGVAAEYIFCDIEGGAWSCDEVSRKTPTNGRKNENSVVRMDVPTIKVKMEEKPNYLKEIAVFFDVSSAQVNDTQVAKIRGAINDIKNSSRIAVAGYTDNTGSQRFNRVLSQRRADAVVNLLIQEGVAPENIESVGRGKCCYIDDNRFSAGKARNRRAIISFQFLEKGHL